MVIAGKEYGSGSSRDWAAKGTLLLGVKAVIAESFERIHRSNLVNMGVLPLQFKTGAIAGVAEARPAPRSSSCSASPTVSSRAATCAWWPRRADGTTREFAVTVRIDTPEELVAFRHGGILPYVVRQLVSRS